MELREFFVRVGGDYEQVILRLPTADMVKRFVLKFAKDPSYADLKNALETADLATAFRAAHTLKGTAANLGLDALGAAASALTEQLRNAAELPAAEYVAAVDEAYAVVIRSISELEEG